MKIEIDKPVVPQFIAEWIEKEKKRTPFHKSFARAINMITHDDDWEILGKRSHWIYLKNLKEFTIGTSSASHMEIDVMTNEEWNRLGINDTNADFEAVE